MKPVIKFSSFATALLTAACAATAVTGLAHAADKWPDQPIRMIVPFPPGGNMDTLARVLSDGASKDLGVSIIVENKPGGMAQLGADALARSNPDGYTFMLAPSATATVLPVLRSLPFDPFKDIDALAGVAGYVPIMAVRNDLGVKTLAELVELAKANPGKLTYSSVGNGSASHMNGEMFKKAAGIDLLHVPFKGSADALTNLMGGNVDIIIDGVAIKAAQAGRVTPLATFYTERHVELPDLPTAAEAGVDVRIPPPVAFGLFAPAGVPAAAKQGISHVIKKALDDKANQDRIIAMSLLPAWVPEAEYDKALLEDYEYNKTFLPEIGVVENARK